MTERNLTIPALDGYRLAATHFSPQGKKNRKVIAQINSAIGVWRRYYRFYARFLASRGFHVVTYDYRGIGDSIDDRWQGGTPCLQDWGEQDLAGVIDWISKEFPRHRLVCIGHSGGGQLLGLAQNNGHARAQLSISAQSGYWRHYRFRDRPRLLLSWYLIFPLLARVLGRFPGYQIDYSEDLPAGVALMWARWCRNPHYASDRRGRMLREHYRGFRGRMRFYVIDDDRSQAPVAAVRALAEYYENADVQIMHIAPADFGVESIGHFGFFREMMPTMAWQKTVDWMWAAVHANMRQSID